MEKVVLVTGAASGIGFATAKRFAAAGARVVLFDLNEEGAKEAAATMGGLALAGDASVEAEVSEAVAEIVRRFSRLDILVNNAGIEAEGSVVEMSCQTWDRIYAVNVRSMFLFAKYAIPNMRPGAAIVNISSIDALVSYPGLIAYDSSKAAVLAFTRTLAVDHGKDGIRVNAICPGYTETPLLQAYFDRHKNPESARQAARDLHPLGRLGRSEDIAEVAYFLASEAAAFVTGTHIVVDGGLTALGH